MGKIVEKKKKKKGRPSLLDIQKRTLREQQQQQNHSNSNSNSNSDRRTTQLDESALHEDDESGKKFKLVVRIPSHKKNIENSSKKRKMNEGGGRSVSEDEEKQKKYNFVSEPADTPSGTGMESGPATPLPDKKLLVFILDRLQKKDTYRVFSEPVDPKELPDYHDIVSHPMDFATVRKKLSSGAYGSLEELEEDVFLICSNAMKYNASDTIYFRQARSIQELAKKDFENLRQESDDDESQPKVVRRGRPPTKNLKTRLGRPPIDRTGSELYTDATLAHAGDNNIGSSTYDLRRGPLSGRCGPSDMSGRSYHGEYTWSAEHKSEVNNENSASYKGVSMKFGKKHFILDENRRNTRMQSYPSDSRRSPSVLATFDGEKKQLMAVGLHMEHGFARSLARFAATLGPIAWKMASQKIERALPAGVKFGPGWVGENETPSQSSVPISLPPQLPQQSSSLPTKVSPTTVPVTLEVKVDKSSQKQEPLNNTVPDVHFNTTNSPSEVASSSSVVGNLSDEPTEGGEIIGGLKSENRVSLLSSNNAGVRSSTSFEIHQGPVKPSVNGLIGGFQNFASHMDKQVRQLVPVGGVDTDTELQQSSLQESCEHRKSDSVPPDLNIRFQSPVSPASTRQPDLALQL